MSSPFPTLHHLEGSRCLSLGLSSSTCVLVAQLCLTLCDPVDCSPQAPLSMGFSRQEYWSG